MINEIIKKEMDSVEKKILSVIFGNNFESNNMFKFIVNWYPDILDSKIQKFEKFVEPVMLEDGTVNIVMLKDLIKIKFGEKYASVIPDKNIKLSELVNFFVKILGGIL